jgi:uncharacterized protein YgbK (DUF1537 family)
VRILADDLTGALDTGAEFVGCAGTVQAFWHGGLPPALPPSAAIDSGTRERPAEQARAVVAGLAPALAAGEIAYKKVDSLIRGATVQELAACFRAGPWRACVFAPAFPFQGRVTRNGRQWARSGDGWVPAGPPLLEALLAEGLAAQPGRLGDRLPAGISVFDAESDDALDAIAALPGEGVLWCGTGGLARALAGSDPAVGAALPGPILGLFGSDRDETFAQLAACDPHWVRLGDDADRDRAAGLLEAGLALVSVELPTRLPRDVAAARIGRALHGVVERLPRPGSLLVAGGETLRALCVAFGAASLELQGRIQPGLPRSVLRGGAWEGVTVVSKSGAFGGSDLLRALLARNGFYQESMI